MKGKNLEEKGKEVLSNLGLHVNYDLNDARLLDIDPDGSHESGQHLEVDYLIPTDNFVLVGEITGRSSSKSDVKEKFRSFKNHFNTIKNCEFDTDFWLSLGVPEEDIHHYVGRKELRGFFITNQYTEYSLAIPDVPNIVSLYKNNWETLISYSNTVGSYAKRHFLEKLEISADSGVKKDLVFTRGNSLSAQRYRSISSNVGSFAHLYRFDVSPYEILPITKVARRDNLPSLHDDKDDEYQRPLREEKINSIRNILRNNKNFLFPNNILCVLSSDCHYSEESHHLTVPYEYGSITVVDGQHRLYSYADEQIESLLTNPLIPVAAIEFETEDRHEISSYSAYIFLEINANQTKIEPKYLDSISYDILGDTDSKSLAAKILKEVNEMEDDCLYGLFDIYRSGQGFFEIGTIRNKLSQITNLDKVDSLTNAERGARFQRRSGYENLFDEEIDSLSEAEVMVEKGQILIRRFFKNFKKRFRLDWPDREIDQTKQKTTLSLAKSFAGLIRLIQYFLEEGSDWSDIDESLDSLKKNLMTLRSMDEYSESESPILDKGISSIPDSGDTTMDFYRFFRANISSPTPISDIGS